VYKLQFFYIYITITRQSSTSAEIGDRGETKLAISLFLTVQEKQLN